jgi:hypothetical protein
LPAYIDVQRAGDGVVWLIITIINKYDTRLEIGDELGGKEKGNSDAHF